MAVFEPTVKIRIIVTDPAGLGGVVLAWRKQARETTDPERMVLLIEHADAVSRCLEVEPDERRTLRLPRRNWTT